MAKKAKTLKTVRISRKRWFYGDRRRAGYTASKLLIPDTVSTDAKGKMCCLGFAALACGVPRRVIRGQGAPSSVVQITEGKPYRNRLSRFLKDGEDDCNDTVYEMMEINDALTLTRAEKEKALKPLARKIGLRFVFVP